MNALEAVTTHKARFSELADLPADVLLMFAQEIAREQQQHENEEKQRHCAVCFALLTDEDIKASEPNHFHRTCKDHEAHRTAFDLSRVRATYGIGHWVKFPPFWKL